jgi:hypothetical protein
MACPEKVPKSVTTKLESEVRDVLNFENSRTTKFCNRARHYKTQFSSKNKFKYRPENEISKNAPSQEILKNENAKHASHERPALHRKSENEFYRKPENRATQNSENRRKNENGHGPRNSIDMPRHNPLMAYGPAYKPLIGGRAKRGPSS